MGTLPGNSIQGSQLQPKRKSQPLSSKVSAGMGLRLPHPVPCTLTLSLFLLSKMGTDPANTDQTLGACSPYWAQPVLTWCSPQGTSCPRLAGNRNRVTAAVPFQATLSPRGTSAQACAAAPGRQPLPVRCVLRCPKEFLWIASLRFCD